MKTSIVGFLLSLVFVSIFFYMVFGVVGLEITFLNVIVTAAIVMSMALALGVVATKRI